MARFRLRPPTLLEAVFAAAALLMAWHAVVPTLRRARDAARVDVAARSIRECDRAVLHLRHEGKTVEPGEATLEAVEAWLVVDGFRPVWPEGTDRASFDPTGRDGCTIRVALGDGSSVLVAEASTRVEHAN